MHRTFPLTGENTPVSRSCPHGERGLPRHGQKLVLFTSLYSLECDKRFLVRLGTMMVAFVGCYPQYRTIRCIFLGFGWIRGDWKKEDKTNRRKVYIIEPVVESLLQVT